MSERFEDLRMVIQYARKESYNLYLLFKTNVKNIPEDIFSMLSESDRLKLTLYRDEHVNVDQFRELLDDGDHFDGIEKYFFIGEYFSEKGFPKKADQFFTKGLLRLFGRDI